MIRLMGGLRRGGSDGREAGRGEERRGSVTEEGRGIMSDGNDDVEESTNNIGDNGGGISENIHDHISDGYNSGESRSSSNIDSDSDSNDADDDDDMVGLPPGYLAFLSNKQDNVDRKISGIENQILGDKNCTLSQIKFVREFVYDRGVISIADAMEECGSSCTAQFTDMVNAGDRHVDGTHDLPQSHICRCPTQHIKEIILSRCHVGDAGASALARAISNSCTRSLEKLDLSANNITGVGATCLADCTVNIDAGSFSCNMESLVLSSNPIGSVGAVAFANSLGGKRSADCRLKIIPKGKSIISHDSLGFCCLKDLHVSGCKLSDDDAIILGNALRPRSPLLVDATNFHINGETRKIGLPSLPSTNQLLLLNLHRNRITLRGMRHLYSVIYRTDTATELTEDTDLISLQTIFCQSNHTIELGVIADFGTRNYNIGNFFDQEEDEHLLMKLRNYEARTCPGENADLDQLKKQLLEKWLLKEKMMHCIQINRECAIAMKQQRTSATGLLCGAGRAKIGQVFQQKLYPIHIEFPTRRQDEYGNIIDGRPFFGLDIEKWLEVIRQQPTGKFVSGLDQNLYHLLISWIFQHFTPPNALNMVLRILCENPDICDFHCNRDMKCSP